MIIAVLMQIWHDCESSVDDVMDQSSLKMLADMGESLLIVTILRCNLDNLEFLSKPLPQLLTLMVSNHLKFTMTK